jgi:hypothetical protein
MRVKIAIGLVANDELYRSFSRVIELPVIPQSINAGQFTLQWEDADDELSYSVANELYHIYWEREPEGTCSLEIAAQWMAYHAERLCVHGFIEDLLNVE